MLPDAGLRSIADNLAASVWIQSCIRAESTRSTCSRSPMNGRQASESRPCTRSRSQDFRLRGKLRVHNRDDLARIALFRTAHQPSGSDGCAYYDGAPASRRLLELLYPT